jgi:hypothetical protein
MDLSKTRGERRDRTVHEQTIRHGEVDIEYTPKPLSGWGGLALFFEFGRNIGFFDALEKIFPTAKISPNQVSSSDIVKALFTTVLVGGNRFSHVERVRADEVLEAIIDADRVCGSDTMRRLFESLARSECERMYVELEDFMKQLLVSRQQEDILDLDSTILERYGRQEGVAKGYHTARAGQTSHHPLLGMFARSKYIAHCWLRAGGASTLRGPAEFVQELLSNLPDGFKISLVRADSGFHTEEFLETLEERGLDYIVAARMRQPMQRLVARIEQPGWVALDELHDVAEIVEQQPNWRRPRRLIFIRHQIRKEGRLFEIPVYEYSALVTSLSADIASCTDLYDHRGECENTIKEFKNDFGARGFCISSFYGTEMVFRLLAVLFNLVSEFKYQVLQNTSVTLQTIRVRIFVLGAILGRAGRRLVLRLGLRQRWKESFSTLLARASSPSFPTAAQLQFAPANPYQSVPSHV